MRSLLGIDVGGTFTDLVHVAGDGGLRVTKVLNADGSAQAAVNGALSAADDPAAVDTIIYGTTVATNAVLERSGAKTVLVTTEGFRDVLELQRQTRTGVWDLYYERPAPLVPRDLRLEVNERIDGRGEVVVPMSTNLEALMCAIRDSGARSIAVCLLNAYVNGAHEQEIRERLRDAFQDAYISISSEVAGTYKATTSAGRTVTVELVAMYMLDERRDGMREEYTVQVNGGPAAGARASLSGGWSPDPYPATAAAGLNALPGLRSLPPGMYTAAQIPFAVKRGSWRTVRVA